MTQLGDGRIVVGVDGSPASKEALAWALAEARLRQATVEVVHVWSFPTVGLTTYGTATLPAIAPADLEHAARETMDAVLARAVDQDHPVPLRTTVEEGHPVDVLLERAKGADLLVVGSRGHGGFAGMLLGSVSSHVVQHAPCPVVVVRAGTDH